MGDKRRSTGLKEAKNKSWISNRTISKIIPKRSKKKNLNKALQDDKSTQKQTGMSEETEKRKYGKQLI